MKYFVCILSSNECVLGTYLIELRKTVLFSCSPAVGLRGSPFCSLTLSFLICKIGNWIPASFFFLDSCFLRFFPVPTRMFNFMSVPLFLEKLYCMLRTDLLLREYKTNRVLFVPPKFSPSTVITGGQRCRRGERTEAIASLGESREISELVLIRSFLKEERFPLS